MSTTLTTVDTIIKALQDVAGAMPGIRKAPDYPPGKATIFPFVTTYPGYGEAKLAAVQFATVKHTIVSEIHWALKDVARDMKRASPFLERYLMALLDDPQLGTAVNSGAIVDPITYRFGALDFYSGATIGWHFEIPVKSQGATS